MMKNIPEFDYRLNRDKEPILTANKIEEHAIEFLQEYQKTNSSFSIYDPQPTPIEDIIENYCGITIDYKTFSDKDILGATAFSKGIIQVIENGEKTVFLVDKGTIIISNELAEDSSQEGRLLYTFAHELGHCVYHRKLYEEPDNSNQPSLFSDEISNKNIISCHREFFEIENNKNWIEWQADYFASCILMPKESVHEFWKPYILEPEKFELTSELRPKLSDIDSRECEFLIYEFIKKYKVSKKAAVIRLKKLNYLERRFSL